MQLDRSTPPSAGPLPAPNFPAIQRYKLSNGLPVYCISFGTEDLVELQFNYAAGHSRESQTGLANLTSRMMIEGTRSYDSLALSEMLDFYGASIDIESGFESTTFSLTSLTKHLTPSLELLEEILFGPTFQEHEFKIYIQRSLQQLEVEEQKTTYIARKNFSRHLFGADHPYGRFTGKSEIIQIRLPQLVQYYAEYFAQGPQFILACGRFDTEVLLDGLEHYFGTNIYSGKNIPSAAQSSMVLSAAGIHEYPIKDTLQSTIRAGHLAIPRNHADFNRLQLVNLIFGGYFGSRLMKNIREEKGYTYGIGSSLTGLRYSGYLGISTDVANEYIAPVKHEIIFEMQRMQRELVGREELDTARNYFLGILLSRRETLFQIGEIVRNALSNELEFSDIDKAFRELPEMTPEDIQTLARKYFHPEQLVWVIAGKSGALTPTSTSNSFTSN
jgi:predicted Zn-dependent peptidase